MEGQPVRLRDKLNKLRVEQEKKSLILASKWVKKNLVYEHQNSEFAAKDPDTWIESLKSIIELDGFGDCDDYAMVIYMMCRGMNFDVFNWSHHADRLRLGLTISLDGQGHMVCVYYGEDRRKPLIVTSTGYFTGGSIITLQEMWNQGSYLYRTFNENATWRHRKPTKNIA